VHVADEGHQPLSALPKVAACCHSGHCTTLLAHAGTCGPQPARSARCSGCGGGVYPGIDHARIEIAAVVVLRRGESCRVARRR
jgi:hypothetical protein